MGAPKWDWTMRLIAWLDAETSGLVRPDLPWPLLLEVALVVTDGDLRELGRYEAVIRHDEAALDALDPHPVVREMHEESGLWGALREPGTTPLDDAERAMIELVDACAEGLDPGDGKALVDTRPVVWGGFSPAAIDRPVIARYMPAYYQRIHHRSVDVSAIKLAMKNWGGVELPEADATHRALADTLDSIRLARSYRSLLQQAVLVPRGAEALPAAS